MPVKTHRLSIAGHVITVRSTADDAYVRSLAEMVDVRVRRVADQGAGPVGTTLLAALGLADEVMQARSRADGLRREVRDRSNELLATLAELER